MTRPDAHEKCSAGRWPFARQGPGEMGFSIPSIGPVRWIYLEIVVREWEPVSTQGVCGSIIPPRLSRSSPSTLLSIGRPPFVSPHLLPDARLLAASTARWWD